MGVTTDRRTATHLKLIKIIVIYKYFSRKTYFLLGTLRVAHFPSNHRRGGKLQNSLEEVITAHWSQISSVYFIGLGCFRNWQQLLTDIVIFLFPTTFGYLWGKIAIHHYVHNNIHLFAILFV